jgi:hypothetical protein
MLLTHCPMQLVYPGAQLQKPPVQASKIEQRLPQRPQFSWSLTYEMVSTQLTPHHSRPTEQLAGPLAGLAVGVLAVGLIRTLPLQAALEHFWPAVQALPQPPQLFLSVLRLRQRPLQFVWPGLQVILGLHLPLAQVSPSLQAFPQFPQLLRSLSRSTQVVPHWV